MSSPWRCLQGLGKGWVPITSFHEEKKPHYTENHLEKSLSEVNIQFDYLFQ